MYKKRNDIKKIAIYDFDGTLYGGETISDFYFFCAKRNWFLLLLLPYFVILYILKKYKLISLKTFKEKCFIFLGKKISQKKVYKFWGKRKKKIYPWVRKELERDKKRGYYIICISATPEFLIKGIVLKYLQIDYLIGTRLSTEDNRKIIGENCKGEEKVKRLEEWLEKRDIKEYEIVKMVSDSMADKPLYDIAKYKFAVSPRGKFYKGLPKRNI